jgi:hypothetical protein
MYQYMYLANIFMAVLITIWTISTVHFSRKDCTRGEIWACNAYLIWIASIILFYFVKDHIPIWTELVILDAGNVSVLAAAAFLAVEKWVPGLTLEMTFRGILLALAILIGWDIIIGCIGHRIQTQKDYVSLLISPSLTVSTLSLLGLAAICFIRYRLQSLPFIVIATLYSILQVPAYNSSYLFDSATGKSAVVFYMLALGKLLYTHSFLATLAYKRINRRTHMLTLTALNATLAIGYIFYRVIEMLSIN